MHYLTVIGFVSVEVILFSLHACGGGGGGGWEGGGPAGMHSKGQENIHLYPLPPSMVHLESRNFVTAAKQHLRAQHTHTKTHTAPPPEGRGRLPSHLPL